MPKMLGFSIALLLAIHAATVQGELTGFFKTLLPRYTSEAQEIDVLFTLQAPARSSPSVSLTSVLDRSLSMVGNKIDLLKKTQQFLVKKLAEGNGRHSLGFIMYSNLARELSPLQPVTPDNNNVLRALIGGIFPNGASNIGAGLVRGLLQQNEAQEGRIKSVFLFTDGVPTHGVIATEEILSIVRSIQLQSSRKITITTFGFGADLDTEILEAIAKVGGGETYKITNEKDIPIAFGDALGGLLSTAAEDIVISFKPENRAMLVSAQTSGDVFSENGVVRVKFSNLFAEEKRDIVIKLKVPDAYGNQRVLDASIDYVDASTLQKVFKKPEPLVLDRTRDDSLKQTPETDVEAVKLKFTVAKVLVQAMAKFSQGDNEGAATAIAAAIATVEVYPVKDNSIIQALLADIQTIRNLLGKQEEERAAEKVEELEKTLIIQRSSSTESDLESEKLVDTAVKRQTRDEIKNAVFNGDTDKDVYSIAADTSPPHPGLEVVINVEQIIEPGPEVVVNVEQIIAPGPEAGRDPEEISAPVPEAGRDAEEISGPGSEAGTDAAQIIAPSPEARTDVEKVMAPGPEAGTDVVQVIVPIPEAIRSGGPSPEPEVHRL